MKELHLRGYDYFVRFYQYNATSYKIKKIVPKSFKLLVKQNGSSLESKELELKFGGI